jgi:predicted RNA binding protein YcfA (HicA-like mRNA interferase family)
MGKQYTRRELIRIARERGWELDETRGKGSHILAMKDGERPFPIPRIIKPGILASIKKRLGIDDCRRGGTSPLPLANRNDPRRRKGRNDR